MEREVKVLVNGVELHCNISGSGPTPLLCIAGATAPSHWALSSQLEYFGRSGSGYTVIAFDPRGYGGSHLVPRTFSVTPEHHTKIDARDANEIMKSLGYEKYCVLGWCDGGIIAIYLAALFPDAVKGIALCGTRVYFTEREVEIAESIRDVKVFESHIQEIFSGVYGSASAFQAIWSKYTDSVAATYEYCKEKNGELCSVEMAQVRCPTLILHGAKDKMALLSQAQHINDSISNSQLIVMDAGHFLPGVEGFNITVENFFKD